MTMFRYKAKVQESTTNYIGHGYTAVNNTTMQMHSLTPAFDFYDGATFLFRLHGVADQTNKSGNPIKMVFDASISGSEVSQSSPTWPTSLDQMRVYRASDGAARVIVTSASSGSHFSITDEGFEAGGATARFAMLNLTRDADGDGGTDGVAFVDAEEYVFEFSGDFTHVETVYPWPAWAASQAYEAYHIFVGMETGSQPKIYSPDGSEAGAADFDTFAAGLTTSHEADALGGQVFQIEEDFNNPGTNPLQLKETQDADNDVIILRDEPLFYLDTEAASDGTGRSRQSPNNVVKGSWLDNAEVLVMSGSVLNGRTLSADEVWTVHNGALVEGGGGGGQSSGAVIASDHPVIAA